MYGLEKESNNWKCEAIHFSKIIAIAIIGSLIFDRIILRGLNRALLAIQNIGSGGGYRI